MPSETIEKQMKNLEIEKEPSRIFNDLLSKNSKSNIDDENDLNNQRKKQGVKLIKIFFH